MNAQLDDYASRLKEVLRNTGQLTDIDLDYCLELTKQEVENSDALADVGDSREVCGACGGNVLYLLL